VFFTDIHCSQIQADDQEYHKHQFEHKANI